MSLDSIMRQKSLHFAQRIVRLYQYMVKEHHETVMSRQILRSGTSIGANISEGIYGSSRKDFVSKLYIAEKESAETRYWLELLNSCDYIPKTLYHSLDKDCCELLSMLAASIKSST